MSHPPHTHPHISHTNTPTHPPTHTHDLLYPHCKCTSNAVYIKILQQDSQSPWQHRDRVKCAKSVKFEAIEIRKTHVGAQKKAVQSITHVHTHARTHTHTCTHTHTHTHTHTTGNYSIKAKRKAFLPNTLLSIRKSQYIHTVHM